VWLEFLPWFLAMAVLIACSCFFSASEAALFSLRDSDRRSLAKGNRAQRLAAQLLRDPDRLLSAVLFWNLVINISYFAVTSITSIRIEQHPDVGRTQAVAFTVGSLLAIIFFSEMLPKSVGVLSPRRLGSLVSFPMAASARAVDWLMPVLRAANVLSRRVIWPKFKREPQMEVNDLERAIELSTTDARLIKQEQAILQNIVMLTEIRVDEWMRPRTQFQVFSPPVSLADLDGKITPSGYLLVSETDTEEVAAAINLETITDLPDEHLEHYATPVSYVPWSASVATALEKMHTSGREVVAVVNEFGETIGILTFEDLLDTLFSYSPSRSKRLLDQNPIHFIEEGKWLVAGVTSLRRLSRFLDMELPYSRSVTIGGVLQETLQRLVRDNDEGVWGPFHFRVLEAPQRGHMLIELTIVGGEEAGS
jgi:putative hemolysin